MRAFNLRIPKLFGQIGFSVIFLLLLACSTKKKDLLERNTSKIKLNQKVGDLDISFSNDHNTTRYELSFSDSIGINNSNYKFSETGVLTSKSTMNFWGETERYFFDVNGTMTKYRKLVKINPDKIGVQEIIGYRNGVIDNKKSHYFDFNIIDSTKEKYKVSFEYLGGCSFDTITIHTSSFPYYISDITNEFTQKLINQNKVEFWVKHKEILDSQFNFIQIDVQMHILNDRGIFSPDTISKPFYQGLILRKWLKNSK